MLAALTTLIQCLPEILKFLQTLAEQIENSEADRTIKNDIARINVAFKTRDTKLLHDVFFDD